MPFWPFVKDVLPWPLAIAVAVLVAVIWGTPPGRRFWERVLTWSAVHVRFRLRALRRYRDEVLRLDSEVPLPFAAPGEQPVKLAQIYVGRSVGDRLLPPANSATNAAERPVPRVSQEGRATAGTDSMEQRLSTSYRQKAAVITGEPGSGKSLLLQALVYGWANRYGKVNGEPVPVRINLPDIRPELRPDKPNPLDENGELYPLHQLIVRSFDLRGVPHAMRFVLHGLRNGRLWLLLDGLDEVSKTNEDEVRRLLDQARRRYPRCQFAVTCRAAVYRDRLPGFETLSLGGFTDSNIDEFLARWAERPDGSLEQIGRLKADLHAGHDRLRQLAHSPLLLTYMAYVYGRYELDNPLPGSRARFFEEVVDFLLTHKAGDEFSAESKYVALQRLALRALRAERQVLSHEQVIAEITSTLPQAGLPEDSATPLLREIVHRTGLLRKLHARNEYQFAHLSLQEFFAATTFGDHATELLAHYRSAPDTWREVLRLWCGHTSANLPQIIDMLAQTDQLLAVECLAESDGDYLPEWFAEWVKKGFRMFSSDHYHLETSPDEQGAKPISPLSLLAGNTRARGAQVRKLFMDFIDSASIDTTHVMLILAGSGHPEAADFLMRRMRDDPKAAWAFRSMGDAAVNALWRLYRDPGEPRSCSLNVMEYGYPLNDYVPQLVDDVAAVASPLAARRLAGLLTDSQPAVRITAALHLSNLLILPSIERELQRISYPDPPPTELPWQPFTEGCSPDFVRLMNHVVTILTFFDPRDFEPDIDFTDFRIDNRIATFMVAHLATTGMRLIDPLPDSTILEKFPAVGASNLKNTFGASDHVSNTRVDTISLDGGRRILTELMQAAYTRAPAEHQPYGLVDEWCGALLDSIPESGIRGVLSMMKGRRIHDLDVDWRPIGREVAVVERANPAKLLQFSIAAIVSIVSTAVFLRESPEVPWLPLWFETFAYGAAVGGAVSVLLFRTLVTTWPIVGIVVIGAIPMMIIGFIQFNDWSQTWGWVWTVGALAVLGLSTMLWLGTILGRQNPRHKALSLVPLLPWAGLVLYRLSTSDSEAEWLQWLAGTGSIALLLCCLQTLSRTIVRYHHTVVAFLPIIALSWFGFDGLLGPSAATMICCGEYVLSAAVLIALDRYVLRRENPLSEVIVGLAGVDRRVGDQRERLFGDWVQSDMTGRFRLHSPAN